MINLHADRTQSHYSRCYALSAFLNIMAPDIKFCFISLRHFIGHHTIQSKGLHQRQFMRSFGKFCSLMNEICKWLNLKPQTQVDRFCESGGMQDFRFELVVWKGKMKLLHINWLSICLQKFLGFDNSREKWLLDLIPMHFIDQITQIRNADTLWCMQ